MLGATGLATLGGSVASAGVGGVAGPAASGALSQHFGLAVPLLAGAAGFAVITAWLAALAVPPGLDFAAAGILFAVGSALTAAGGRRAVNLPVIRYGILAMIAGLSLGVLSAAPSILIVMLCATTAARSVLWTVSYPMAAAADEATCEGRRRGVHRIFAGHCRGARS